MKPSTECKDAGLSGLKELADISGTSVQTLNNWHKFKYRLFYTVLSGAVQIKKRETAAARIRDKGASDG